jgi:tetratricopeptide (TPR) repeat protein
MEKQYQAVCSNCNCTLILDPAEVEKGEFTCEECKYLNKFEKNDLVEMNGEDSENDNDDIYPEKKKTSKNYFIIGFVILALIALSYYAYTSDSITFINRKGKAEEHLKKGNEIFTSLMNSQSPDMQLIQTASSEFDKALELEPENSGALYGKSMILANTGKFSEAIIQLNKVISLNATIPEAYFYRALCNLQTGDLQNSLKDFNKTLELNPENPDALFYRSNTKYLMKDFAGAKEDITKIIETNPTLPNSYALRGLCDVELGNKKTGCEDFKKAKELGFPQADSLILQYCK